MKLQIAILLFSFSSIVGQNIRSLNCGEILYNSGIESLNKNKKDSALFFFSKSINYYKQSDDCITIIKPLFKIAQINYDLGFLDKSENISIEILKILELTNRSYKKSDIYNLLGNILKKKKNFNDALNYHTKALTIRKNALKHRNLTLASLNNIALVHQENGNYFKAITFLNRTLKFDSLKTKNPTKYAKYIDNKAYNLFLADSLPSRVLPFYLESLKIREQESDIDGLTTCHLHLAEYFIKNKNNSQALYHLKNSLTFAKKNNDNHYLLIILEKLSDIDPLNSNTYFKDYKKTNNLIVTEERKLKNISAKIEYETEQKEKENLQLKTEKEQQTLQIEKEKNQKWLFGGGFAISILTVFIVGYYYKKNKKQTLLIEGLQKELHHRVKNNLSIISTFIDVTKDKANNKFIEAKLNELQNRIASFHHIHEQLNTNSDVAHLKLKEYLENLVNNIENSFSNQNIKVHLNIRESLQINATQSFPVGLIVNEFITNSYKYAFNPDTLGTIVVEIIEDNSKFILNLHDNGKGLPTDFDLDETPTFGLRIIKLLSEQLNGSFKLLPENGVLLTIEFPKKL